MLYKRAVEILNDLADRSPKYSKGKIISAEQDKEIVEALKMALRSMKSVNLDPDDFATLAICAVRYCHGRQTYMPKLVRRIITPHLSEISDGDIGVMVRDCEEMNDFDYGDPVIDKPGWGDWYEVLKKEKKKRDDSRGSS